MSRPRERRREPRADARHMRARVGPGHHLVVIDMSAGGVLVEAARPLRPGSRIDLHLEDDDRRDLLRARVIRCTVAALSAETGVTYRAALSFDSTSDWVRESLTRCGYQVPGDGIQKPQRNGDELPSGLPLERVTSEHL
ncbi:MAG: PilZ domain-containing protein [Vicinamibacterales bacterium]